MASYTATKRTIHKTLAAGTVDTVTLDDDYAEVEVLNRDGSAEIYFLVDPGATAPTVGADGTEVVPAGMGAVTLAATVNRSTGGATPTVVKLISSGTPAYSIAGR